ncbi:hypothetical protein FRC12_012534 [Ceratobasidium sp. 428]|nr:hypothetical protein FRC12_012534 [Ceratobasidium sp. 428]
MVTAKPFHPPIFNLHPQSSQIPTKITSFMRIPNSHVRVDSNKATSVISSTMVGQPVATIIAILTEHLCCEITNQLDLAKCQHGSPFARGGFGDIYQGTLKGGEKVAIKCARLYLQEDDEKGRKALKRTARELYYWSSFNHKNVLGLLGLAQYHGQLAPISPWMDKGTLLQYIKQNPTADRYQLCADISEGVAYLHQIDAVKIRWGLQILQIL